MPAVASAETLPVVSVINQSSTNCVRADPVSESAWPPKMNQNRSFQAGPGSGRALADSRLEGPSAPRATRHSPCRPALRHPHQRPHRLQPQDWDLDGDPGNRQGGYSDSLRLAFEANAYFPRRCNSFPPAGLMQNSRRA